ncbi:MAG: hypothetical protein ACFFD4_37610, partial [Candidatus Odinarchaeota archaeon]
SSIRDWKQQALPGGPVTGELDSVLIAIIKVAASNTAGFPVQPLSGCLITAKQWYSSCHERADRFAWL